MKYTEEQIRQAVLEVVGDDDFTEDIIKHLSKSECKKCGDEIMIETAMDIKNDILDEKDVNLAINMCNRKYIPVDELESLLESEHEDDMVGALRITRVLRKHIFTGDKK